MDKINLSKQTADAILLFIDLNAFSMTKNLGTSPAVYTITLKEYVNSLVSEDEPAIQVSPNWYDKACRAILRRPDTEITKRVIAKFEDDWWYSPKGGHNHEPTLKDVWSWLNKEGK